MTIPVVKREYSLQIDFKPTKKLPGWTNLFRMASEPGNNVKVGNRIPAIFFRSNTFKLHVCSAINGNKNSCWNSDTLTEGKLYRLNIVQSLQFTGTYRYSISLDGDEKYQTGNTKAQEFKKVKMYLADEYYTPAGAEVLKVKFQNTGMLMFVVFLIPA